MMKAGITLAALAFATSCAEDAKTSPAAASTSTTALEGVTWGSCKSTSASGTTVASSYKSTISFIGGVATSSVISYSAAGCPDASKSTTIRFTGTYVIGTASTDVAGATNLDIVYNKEFVTLGSDQVTKFNTAKECGKSDWSSTEVEITTLSACKLITISVPSSSYLVFKVDSAKGLYSGQPDATNDGKSAAKRAKAFTTDPLTASGSTSATPTATPTASPTK